MSSAFRRIIRLQRQILLSIRADVRKAMGPQSVAIRRYYEAYKREFHGNARHSTKEELLKACLKADIILMGDYHTFAQSQKAALRLLRELVNWEPRLALGFELVPARHQRLLDDWLSGGIGEKAFLERMDYEANWGFPWEHFRPLFAFAREHGLETLALNADHEKLETRDRLAAELIGDWASRNPKGKLFVLYGDLHLARGHIPRFLKAELTRRQSPKSVLTIFQNSETLYWRLAEGRMAHTVDVLNLGRGRFCIMNAAPWVKLQSYLEWAERSQLIESDDDSGGINLHEMAHDRLHNLAEALRLELPGNLDFSIQTISDLSFLSSSPAFAGLSRGEIKAIKYHVLGNRTVFIPGSNMIYMPYASVNALAEGVTMLAHSALSGSPALFHEPTEHFFAATLASTISYFGSKVLNHKRKCDLAEDYRRLLEVKLSSRALPQERMQRKVAKLVLRHLGAQATYLRTRRYRAPLSISGPQRVPLFLATARALGSILGERLYASFVEGGYPAAKIEALFRTRLDDSGAARKMYLKMLEDLPRTALAHSSKLDLF